MLKSMLDYFVEGGLPIMLSIAFGSVIAGVLIVERFIFYYSTKRKNKRLTAEFFMAIEQKGIESSLALLNGFSGLLRDIFKKGLENRDMPKDLFHDKLNEIIIENIPGVEKSLSTIATLSGLMPLLGLLGTVTGMIETFQQIVLHGTGDPRAMAHGIRLALYTTQFGLVCAIPMIFFHNLLCNRADKLISEIQSNSLRLVNMLKSKENVQ